MTEGYDLDMLCFGAHPDDIEILAGGLILRHVVAGYRVGLIDMTRGEMGTRGGKEIRKSELNRAAEVLGVVARDNLALPDSQMENSFESKLAAASAIRKYRPRVVIHQGTNYRHPDHRVTGEIIRDACFLAGLKDLSAEGEPFRPFKVVECYNYRSSDQPSFLIDISDVFEQKLDAIAAYESQFPRGEQKLAPHLGFGNVYEWVTARNRYFGMMIRTQYAEPYTIFESIEVDDLVKMPVASM